MKRKTATYVLLAAAGLLVCATAEAQSAIWHSYAAKFVCGSVQRGPSAIAVDGKYKTTVNIHNPNYLLDLPIDRGGGLAPVQFYKKIVLALPQGQDPLPPSCFILEFVNSDEALSVTCRNIRDQLAISGLPSTGVLEGYVVLLVPPFQDITSPVAPELDVEVLYTARSRSSLAQITTNGVGTWDTENVDFKVVRGQPSIPFCSPPG